MKKELLPLIFLTLLLSITFVQANQDIEVIITPVEEPIAEVQGIVAAEMFGAMEQNPDIEIKRRFSSFEGVTAMVSQETLQELEQNPAYHVQKARRVHATLDVSIPQVDGNATWDLQLNGLNMTGTHETVCVIDTGVNYSHINLGGCYGNNSASSNCTVIGGWDYVNDDWDPMDDEGHGTHVTGIVTSNDTTYMGVAPGTKIIAIKALDSGGSGFESDIIAGVDWCVNNATTFNISVISMSLSDCTNYTSACDSSYAAWATAVNAAAAKNISVVASAGNGPFGGCSSASITSTDGPAAPACFSNVTSVGGVNDTDEIHPPWQRGGLFQLLAPGYTVRSTDYTSGFSLKSGTSMAAPHVSGIFAIAQQLSKQQTGNYFQRQTLENAFNNTGLVINDSFGTLENFTRVNSYQGILSLDDTGPVVTLANPTNNTINLNFNQSFNCNFTDWQLTNMTFYVWNSTGLYYNSSAGITGMSNETTVNLTNIPKGTYTWNCQGQDAQDNVLFATNNNTLTTGGVFISLISPQDNQRFNNYSHNFTCNTSTDTSASLANVTFFLWNNTGTLLYNETTSITGSSNQTTYNYTFGQDGNYTWNCEGYNNQSGNNSAEQNYTIQLDATTPQINSITEDVSSTSATITWTSNEVTNHSISTDLNDTNSSFYLNHSVTFDDLTSSTTYNYVITACDQTNNCNTTSTQSFTTDQVASSGGGGGGGGGGGSSSSSDTTTTTITTKTTHSVNKEDIIKGTTTTIKKEENLTFHIAQENHTLTLNHIYEEELTVQVTIRSEAQIINLTLNEPVKLNLSSSTHYDTLVELQEINVNEVDIYIQAISEPIITEEEPEEQTVHTTEEETTGTKLTPEKIVLILLLLGFIAYTAKKRYDKKKKSHTYHKKRTKHTTHHHLRRHEHRTRHTKHKK